MVREKDTTIDYVEESNMNEIHTDNYFPKKLYVAFMSSWIPEPRKTSEKIGTIWKKKRFLFIV